MAKKIEAKKNVKNTSQQQETVVTDNLEKKPRAGQYVGIILLMVAFIVAAYVFSATGEAFLTENLVMVIAMAVAVIFCTFGYVTMGIVVTAGSVILFVALKVYSMMIGNDFSTTSFLWVILPVLSITGISSYIKSNNSIMLENALLKKQISELVMTDPITNLYNLRSMYMDIQTQISYSERNNSPISLMIIRLRYPSEMKKVLKKAEYEKVVKQLSLLVVDTVRLEDRVYSIDDNGGFGIILTCDSEGTRIVEKRLRSKIDDPKWFSGVSTKHQIRAEVKIGCLEYDKGKYKRDANSFKESVEEEVEYDV